MSEFLLYLFCSLSGRPLQYRYQIEQIDWDNAVEKFRDFSSRLTAEDNITVEVSGDEIVMFEFYDSGIRYKGSPMAINNEVTTVIQNGQSGIDVEIEIWRAGESRILSNVFIVLSALSLSLFIFRLYTRLSGNIEFSPLPFLAASVGLSSAVIVFWLVFRIKYLAVKEGITTILNDN